MGRKLQEALRAHGGDVHGCYGAALGERAGLKGELLVRLVVAPGGAVERAEILKDQVGSRRLGDCLVDAMRRWKVPELAGGESQQVVFPLAFRPDELERAPRGTVVAAGSAKSYSGLQGKGRVTLFLDGIAGAPVSLQRLEADAGAIVPTHTHDGSDEILYLLEGRGEMTLDGRKMPVAGGDAIHIPKGTPHSLVVAKKLVAIQCYAPGGPEQRFKAPPAPAPEKR